MRLFCGVDTTHQITDIISQSAAFLNRIILQFSPPKIGDIDSVLAAGESTRGEPELWNAISPRTDWSKALLRANKVISPSFYYAYFRSYWFISNKLRIAVEGIRDGKSINMDTFWNITIPYPSLDEQYQIAEYLRTVDTRLTNAEQVLGTLLRLRSGLMQQLFIWRAVARKPFFLSKGHLTSELHVADDCQTRKAPLQYIFVLQ